MSTIVAVSRKFNWKPALVVAVGLAIVAMLTSPVGPLGSFWAPTPEAPKPSGVQIPLFAVLQLANALTFGAGIAFLLFGFPLVKSIGPASPRLSLAAHLSISWLLFNWFLHDSLHLHNGMDLNGLLVIDYAFHTTLMAAGVILAVFFLRLLRQPER